jgi:nucleotide sugar dehydrogenase
MTTLRLTVIGTGYLGATHAACMAELGYEVLGVDVDAAKVAALSEGSVPFFEPELEPLLRKHVESGRLRFTTSYAEAADFGDVHFVCVGTPQREGSNAADLRYVFAAVEGLARHLHRPALVVGKSTVPVGTAERLAARLDELVPAGVAVELAWNPEFLREGFAVEDTLHPDRLVFGVRSADAEARLREVYAPVLADDVPAVVTTSRRPSCQGRRQQLPRDEDLVHQRDGGGLRGHRRRRDAAVGGARPRRADRATVPARGSGLRRRLPAQGHPRLHGPGGRARRRLRPWPSS